MELDIKDIEKDFLNIVKSLTDGSEKVVYVLKDGKPVAKMTPIANNKRVGAAKEEMKNFDISLEDFNNIPTIEID